MAHAESLERPAEAGGRFRDVVVQMTPLGPAFMSLKNRGTERQRGQEMQELGLPALERSEAVLADLQEVCGDYARLHPENAFYWQRAHEYVTAHAQGPAAALDLVEQWGFVRNKQDGLDVPDWWNGKMVLPLEFQDYSPDQYPDGSLRAAGVRPERFHALAKKASDFGWMGYYLTKGRLSMGGISLLIKCVTDSVIQLKKQVEMPKDNPLMVYVIGISEDEVAALSNQNVSVIGFNFGFSPVMEKLIRIGRVQQLVAQRDEQNRITGMLRADTQEPVCPKAGEFYVCQLNVAKDGLPVPDASGIVMTNFTLHHNSFEDQVVMIKEMHRAALPLPGGGRAWVAGEERGGPDYLRLQITQAPFCGAEAWDAWASFANAIPTVENLMRRREELAAENIECRFTSSPGAIANAPALFHRLMMPLTHVLMTGY